MRPHVYEEVQQCSTFQPCGPGLGGFLVFLSRYVDPVFSQKQDDFSKNGTFNQNFHGKLNGSDFNKITPIGFLIPKL